MISPLNELLMPPPTETSPSRAYWLITELTVRKTGDSLYLRPTMLPSSCRFVVRAMAAS